MKNIKRARLVKLSFLFLAISLFMLYGPLVGKAQDTSTKCKWVQKLVVVQEYNPRTERLEGVDRWEWVYDCGFPIINESSKERPTSRIDNQQNADKSSITKFSVPKDNPLLGTWKYEKYSEAVTDPRFPIRRSLIQAITLIYSQDGVVESIFVERIWEVARIKRNWKYIPKNDSSSVVEEYQGDDLDERGSIKWINKNQFEYTVTFHSKDTKAVGNKFIFTKQ